MAYGPRGTSICRWNPGLWSRYVAMGDSFTAGLGDPEPLSPGGMRGWADRIAEELSEGRADFRYANLAVSGLVLRQILDRQLGPAIALKPDLVTLSAGGNDLVFHRSDPDRLAATLDAAVGMLSATGATIVLFTGPDWGDTPLLGHNRGRVAVFNENIRTIAARHHGVIADLWALRQLSDPRMWDPDRLHFSPIGHHTIAAMVLESLERPPHPEAAGTQAHARRELAGQQGRRPRLVHQLPASLDGQPRPETLRRPAADAQASRAGAGLRILRRGLPPLVPLRSVG